MTWNSGNGVKNISDVGAYKAAKNISEKMGKGHLKKNVSGSSYDGFSDL